MNKAIEMKFFRFYGFVHLPDQNNLFMSRRNRKAIWWTKSLIGYSNETTIPKWRFAISDGKWNFIDQWNVLKVSHISPWEARECSHQFTIAWENATKPILWEEPGKLVPMLFGNHASMAGFLSSDSNFILILLQSIVCSLWSNFHSTVFCIIGIWLGFPIIFW